MMVLKQIFHSHTLIFTLFFIKSNKFSLFDVLWGLSVKSLLFKKIIKLIPLTKTEELQKVLAQIEALMSREELQKVSQKNK